MNSKSLLIITNFFPDENDISHNGIYIKERVNKLSKFFKEINVIRPTPHFIDTKLNWHMDYTNVKFNDYSYKNVNVFFPRYLFFPFEILKKRKGKNFYKLVDKIIKKENISFDLIHSQFLWPSSYAGIKIKNKYDKNLIVTGHGGDVYKLPFKNKFYNKNIKNILYKSDRIITVSHKNKKMINKIINNYKNTRNINVIPNGYNSKKFFHTSKEDARKKLKLPLEKKIILNVADLRPIKRQKTLIEFIRKTKNQEKDILLIIIGGGLQKKHLKKMINSLNLTECIKLEGPVPHKEIPYWMNSADVFVLPSSNEGFPTVIPEALGSGTPVVASNVGGISEIISNEDVGFLANPNEDLDLHKKILKALNKKWNREKIEKYAEKNYSWTKISEDIMSVYNSIL